MHVDYSSSMAYVAKVTLARNLISGVINLA
jgi:hypothetical protein